jgi:hypothetical protein
VHWCNQAVVVVVQGSMVVVVVATLLGGQGRASRLQMQAVREA